MAQGLNPKQSAFVRAYLLDPNATRAAIAAGYSPKTAAQQGSVLLRHLKVSRAIQTAMDARAKRQEVSADDVLHELKLLAFADIGRVFHQETGDMLPVVDMPEEARRTIAGIEADAIWDRDEYGNKTQIGVTRKIKFWDKLGALTALGKHLKLFTDKVEHSGGVSVSFNFERAAPKAGPQGGTRTLPTGSARAEDDHA